MVKGMDSIHDEMLLSEKKDKKEGDVENGSDAESTDEDSTTKNKWWDPFGLLKMGADRGLPTKLKILVTAFQVC